MVDAETGVRDDTEGGVGRCGEEETEVFAKAADCADRADMATALALDVADAGSCMVDEVRAAVAVSST